MNKPPIDTVVTQVVELNVTEAEAAAGMTPGEYALLNASVLSVGGVATALRLTWVKKSTGP